MDQDFAPPGPLAAPVGLRLPAWAARLGRFDLARYGGSLGVRGLEVLGKFGLYFVVARRLGAADSGLLFFCLTWVNLASSAARMGLERTMTRHVAAELAVGQADAARHTMRTGLLWCSLGGVGWALMTMLLAGPAARHVFGQPELATPLAISAILLVTQTLAIALGYALTGLNRGGLGQLLSASLPPTLVLLSLLAGLRGLNAVLLTYGLSCAICCVLAVIVLERDARAKVQTPPPPGLRPLPTLFRTAAPFLAVEMVQACLVSLPLLLLGAFAPPGEVGAFSVASRISSLVWMVLMSIGSIAAPRFAELHRLGSHTRLSQVNRASRLITLACALPAVMAMLMAPELLLSLVGPHFETAAASLMVLAMGQMVNCVAPLQDVLLGMTGHGRTLRWLSLAQLGLGAMIGVALIPTMGSLGAAITTAISVAIGAIGTTLASRQLVPEAWEE